MRKIELLQPHHTTLSDLPLYFVFVMSVLSLLLIPGWSKAQDITGLEVVKTITHQNIYISAVDSYFTGGHQLVAYSISSGNSGGDTLIIYDFKGDETVTTIVGSSYKFVPKFIDSDQLLYTNNDTLFRVVNFASPTVTTLREEGVTSFAVSPDRTKIALLLLVNNIWQIDLATYNPISGMLTPFQNYTFPETFHYQYSTPSFSPDGKMVALNGGYENDFVYIINTITGDAVRVNTSQNLGTYSPNFYQQNNVLRLAVGGGYAHGNLEIIDVETHSLENSVSVFPNYLYTVAFDQEQQYLACSGYDGILKLFKVEGITVTDAYSYSFLGYTSNVMFTQDSQYLISNHTFSDSVKLRVHRILRVPSAVGNIYTNPITLYPNPTSDIVQSADLNDALITIYDTYGREAAKTSMTGSCIDVGGLPNGVYLLKAEKKGFTRIGSFLKL